MTSIASAALGDVFAAHRRFLWGLCYRLTGSAADADDLVQETFARALARPPARTDEPWRPWLVRVALNLARDLLRRRRRRAYVGPWLPSPVETTDAEPPAFEPVVTGSDGRPLTTEGRYDLLESVSFAFLLALEALTPRQRAVLLLRDVFDYSVRDTADALGATAGNVKTTHHRARRALAAYDRARCIPTRERRARTQQALEALLASLASDDPGAVERLLAADVVAVTDGAGEFHAARKPIVGPARVARFFRNIATRRRTAARVGFTTVNGLPAALVQVPDGRPGEPPRFMLRCDVDERGRITALHSVLATAKLGAVRFPAG